MTHTFPTGSAGLLAMLLGRFAATRAGRRRRAELIAKYCPPDSGPS